MRSIPRLVAALGLMLLVGAAGSAYAQIVPPQPKQPVRKIIHINGGLYLVQNNIHNSAFLVTSAGIVVVDPLNHDFAFWLKQQLAKKYDVPVKYVLYSHYHGDHASGGAVFADTAKLVGQRNMLVGIAPPVAYGNPPLPPGVAPMDKNHDGVLERSEATGRFVASFDQYDYNRDNIINGAEFARAVYHDEIYNVFPPNITFTDYYKLELGGQTIIMYAIGPAHSPDNSVIYFPDEKAVFGVDVFQINRLPLAPLKPTIGDWIDALRFIDNLDYKYALTGHEAWGTKQDAKKYLHYFEDLAKGVAAGIGEGHSLDEIQTTMANTTLAPYKSFERWNTPVRTRQVAEVYAQILGQPSAVDARAAALKAKAAQGNDAGVRVCKGCM